MALVSKEFEVKKIEDLEAVAHFLIQQKYAKIICVNGELGAGKTTLTKVFCRILGCSEAASSPTFSIVNEYEYDSGLVYHFDLYRLNGEEELMDIGIEEYLYSDQYCLIEWPELIMGTILDQYVQVTIKVTEFNLRKVLISEV